jgi:hypothetical protein
LLALSDPEQWVALICPTRWDREQLGRLNGTPEDQWRLRPYGPDPEGDPASFDPWDFIERAVAELATSQVIGVASSSDYPGCLVSAVIAQRLGLPGPSLVSLLRASHKYYSRLAQQVWVPEATPRFSLLDPSGDAVAELTLPFPVFVKPVKSWFSQLARRIDSRDELRAYLVNPSLRVHLSEFVRPFNQLLRSADFAYDAHHLIAEEVLDGHQVTLEGSVQDGVVTVLGIVDSFMYPGSASFEKFVVPSRVDETAVRRMADITRRIVLGLGLSSCMFNIEYIVNRASGSIHIVEINPRMCGQFADLMESVTGVNTYEVLAQVAVGRPPPEATGGRFNCAVSYALRSFVDGRVTLIPERRSDTSLDKGCRLTLFVNYYGEGQRLSGNAKQSDGWSHRYAVANLAGPDPEVIDFELHRMLDAEPIRIVRDRRWSPRHGMPAP